MGFGKLGDTRSEVVEGRGLWPQLKRGGGGRVRMGGCFEGSEGEEEFVFLVEENSWDK